MQNQKKAKASEEEETTTLKTGKLTTERASYSKNVQSKQPTIAGDNRVQRKTSMYQQGSFFTSPRIRRKECVHDYDEAENYH